MKIPDRLAELLGRNQEFDGLVKSAIARIEPWITNSRLPFFPEYTDHGIEHLELVLATASSLIRDQAWSVFTPADSAVIILSILFHDCAMHLTEDGFVALLNIPWRDRSIEDMKDRAWHIEWEDFLGEASRFDGRKLNSLFGDLTPVRPPPSNPSEWTNKDRLLIGEFLRRHHPRLAQEIVSFGVPGPDSAVQLTVADLSATPLLSLAGLVARSHGAPIRRFLPVLERRYGSGGHRACRNVHVTFLMVLVRVADYLQVQAERAPQQVLAVKSLTSPASQREWRAHSSILDIRQTTEDPEALHIEARPPDVEIFFKVRDWIRGIQGELDDSWAVLGEVYGRYSELAPLGIVLRRIRSNTDDIEAISATLKFIPKRAAFRAADADLLKLLIGPLYGDNPSIGMRELIQNAVDAVRELNVLLNDRGLTRADLPFEASAADVVASVEKDGSGQHWATVSDVGLGMTADVIVNYFLTAGASFRRSEDWRKSFETSEGKSKVLRAGRFGIGALAAFLLGNEIHVTTRHVDSLEGISFSATVETEFVELKKCNRSIGTSVRIPLNSDIAQRLSKAIEEDWDYSNRQIVQVDENDNLNDVPELDPNDSSNDVEVLNITPDYSEIDEPGLSDWDWYCLATPSLSRSFLGAQIDQRYSLGELDADMRWKRMDHNYYDGIFWSYEEGPPLACNGIIIPSHDDQAWRDEWGLICPNIHVRDPDGHFPLNLQRSDLQTKKVPFSHELAIDVARSFCAFALMKTPLEIASLQPAIADLHELDAPHIPMQGRIHTSQWFFASDGISFLHPDLFRAAGCRTLVIARIAKNSGQYSYLSRPLLPGLGYLVMDQTLTLARLDLWIRELSDLPFGFSSYERYAGRWRRAHSLLGQFNRIGTRILLTKNALNRYEKVKTAKNAWRLVNTIEWESNGWVLVQVGNCDAESFPFREFADASSPVNITDTLSECYFDVESKPILRKVVAEQWRMIFGQPLLPFAANERQKLHCAVEEILKPYFAAINI
ncbi:MAG: ATP-binding protein [Planctomycetia bacterium]|nr:ATP-binding protein [Planctomycetia bacterium]